MLDGVALQTGHLQAGIAAMEAAVRRHGLAARGLGKTLKAHLEDIAGVRKNAQARWVTCFAVV